MSRGQGITSLALLSAISYICLSILGAEAGNSTDGMCGPLNGFAVCSKASHCCSRYGYCGNGASHCSSGCNPLLSYNVESCYPLPGCQPKTYTFGTEGNARIVGKDQYKAVDPHSIDFIVDTGEIRNVTDGVVLTLKDDKIGTKLSATRAMHYGKMTVEMQTAWSGGVVTAAVLMGDTTEEVDIEFVGSDLTSFQSNVFYDYIASSKSHEVPSDTSTGFATYSVDWKKDKLTWGYNGQDLRTVTSAQKHIPELPMYMQMSIWPGGEAAAEGTKTWAGGAINWENPRYIARNRTFELVVKSVTLECYDALGEDEAYKYVKDASTGKVGFDTVKLAGYGVTNRKKGEQYVFGNPAASVGTASSPSSSSPAPPTPSTSSTSGLAPSAAVTKPAVTRQKSIQRTSFSTSFSTRYSFTKSGQGMPQSLPDPIKVLEDLPSSEVQIGGAVPLPSPIP